MSFPRTNIIDEQKDVDLNKEIDALNNLRKTTHSGWKLEGKNIDFNDKEDDGPSQILSNPSLDKFDH